MAKLVDDSKIQKKAEKIAKKQQKMNNKPNNKTFVKSKMKLIQLSRYLSDKFEKLFSNNRLTVIATLILSVFFVFSVHSIGSVAIIKQVSDTVKAKEVTAEYDSDKYVVEGLPEAADVVLFGDEAAIQSTKNANTYSVFADLSQLGAGEHVIPLSVENLPSNVKASTNPSTVKVSIYTKEFKVFQISPEVINKNAINGLTIEDPILSETTISLKGAKKDLDRVSFVRALIDGKTISSSLTDKDVSSFEGRAIVVAYDEQGNKIARVGIDAGGLDYVVSLAKSEGKPISNLNTIFVGNFPEGQAIKSITLDTEAITINGTKEEIDKVNSLDIKFNLKTEASGTIEGEVIVPDNVTLTSIAPKKITGKIEFGPAVTKTITIPSITKSNSDDIIYDYTVMNDNVPITVEVTGTVETLAIFEQNQQISPVKVVANVADLAEGTQVVSLEIEGSTMYSYKLSQPNVKIKITRR